MEGVAARLPGQLAVAAVGRDEGGDHDIPGVGEKGHHLSDAADVFAPIVGRESEIGAEPVADVVPVKDRRPGSPF